MAKASGVLPRQKAFYRFRTDTEHATEGGIAINDAKVGINEYKRVRQRRHDLFSRKRKGLFIPISIFRTHGFVF